MFICMRKPSAFRSLYFVSRISSMRHKLFLQDLISFRSIFFKLSNSTCNEFKCYYSNFFFRFSVNSTLRFFSSYSTLPNSSSSQLSSISVSALLSAPIHKLNSNELLQFVGILENVGETECNIKSIWQVIAVRLDELVNYFKVSDVLYILNTILHKKREAVDSSKLNFNNIKNKLRLNVQAMSDQEICTALKVITYSKMLDNEVKHAYLNEIEKRLNSFEMIIFVDVAQTLALVYAQQQIKKNEDNLYKSISEILKKKINVKDMPMNLLIKSVHSICVLGWTSDKERMYFLDYLMNNLNIMDVYTLKLLPSVLVSLKSNDNNFFLLIIERIWLMLDEWSENELYSFCRRAAKLNFNSYKQLDEANENVETDQDEEESTFYDNNKSVSNTVKKYSGMRFFYEYSIGKIRKLNEVRHLNKVLNSFVKVNANHVKEFDEEAKKISKSFCEEISKLLPKCTDNMWSGSDNFLKYSNSLSAKKNEIETYFISFSSFCSLIFGVSNIMQKNEKIFKIYCEYIYRFSNIALSKINRKDIITFAFSVNKLNLKAPKNEIINEDVHSKVQFYLKKNCNDVTVCEFGRLGSLISLMAGVYTSACISNYCKILLDILNLQNNTDFEIPILSISAFINKCGNVIRRNALTDDTSKLLLYCVGRVCTYIQKIEVQDSCTNDTDKNDFDRPNTIRETQIKLLQNNITQKTLSNVFIICSSLLEELPYGSPLRGELVGYIAIFSLKMGKAAAQIPKKFITQNFMDVIPSDAVTFKKHLLQNKSN